MQRKWLLTVGVVAAVGVALALGVSANTLLIVGTVLLCPAAMYFGMSGMHQGCGHSGKCSHDHNAAQSDTADAGRKAQDREHKRAA